LAEVLSQNEIDQLFRAISSGEANLEQLAQERDTPKMRVYDFSKANKFSKEQIRTLHIVFENMARQMSTYFSGQLGTMVEITVISVEEQIYREFNNFLPTPVILGILGMPPLHGPLLVEMSPNVCFGIISRLFGGAGDAGNYDRPFTEIEQSVIERMMRQFLPYMVEAWEKITRVEPTLERTETSPQFAQIVGMNEAAAIVTLQFKSPDIDGMMSFCIPHLSIEPIAKQLNTALMFSNKSSQRIVESNSDNIQRRILNTQLCVKVILSETTMTVDDVLSLRLGDVIQLDNRVGEELRIKVEHIPKASGRLGVRHGKYALRITNIIKEEDTVDE
jgi:flagellar motor switch protein FliM